MKDIYENCLLDIRLTSTKLPGMVATINQIPWSQCNQVRNLNKKIINRKALNFWKLSTLLLLRS